jgi:Zn-finger nucleic acid-binding protein
MDVDAICARCGSSMALVPLGQATAYGCSRCAAVLLTHDHANRVRAGVDRAAPVMAEQAAAQKPFVQQALDTGPLHCPLCKVAMQPEWLRDKYVRLDICPSHGVFFDAHELIAIMPPAAPAGFTPGHNNIPKTSVGDAAFDVIGQIFFG